MDDPTAGRHPLDVSRSQPPGVTRRVPVLHLAGEEVGHRLEAAVRVIRGPLRFAGGRAHRPHLVEKEKGIEMAERVGGKGTVDQKACPFVSLPRRYLLLHFAVGRLFVGFRFHGFQHSGFCGDH